MSSLWWLQPGWTDGRCGHCGKQIWPEGDPDWGLCVGCFDKAHFEPTYPELTYPEPSLEDLCGSAGHPIDGQGPRCHCGRVTRLPELAIIIG